MSKFADTLGNILLETIAKSRPGQMYRVNTTSLGKAGTPGEDLAVELAAAMACHSTTYKIGDKNVPVELCSGQAGGFPFIILHASSKPPRNKSPVFVSENFAANLRDERVRPGSPLHGSILVVLMDRVIDTVRASTELTDPGQPLEAGRLIDEIAQQSASTELRAFVSVARDDLRQAALRGRPEYRGRVMETLSQLATESKPDISANLPKLGTWMQDPKIAVFIQDGNRDALRSRLKANQEAAETVRAATEGKSDPVTVLEKKIREDKIDSWSKVTLERANLTDWERDRKRETGTPTKKWDRFRFAKKSVLTGQTIERADKDREVDALVWGNEPFHIAAVYKEWLEAPPVSLEINGQPVYKGGSQTANSELIKVENKSITILAPPSADNWMFYELKVYTGNRNPRGTPDAIIRIARAPSQMPAVYLPSFSIRTDSSAIEINNSDTYIIAESQADFNRASRAESLTDAFAPGRDWQLPCKVASGPNEASDWSFVHNGGTTRIPIICKSQAAPTVEETTFLSGLHNRAIEGESPPYWTYLPRLKSIANGGTPRPISFLVNNELSREDEIIRSRNMFPVVTPAGLRKGELSALVTGGQLFGKVLRAYENMFEWLEKHETLPSLICQDSKFRQLVQAILDAAEACINDEDTDVDSLGALWKIGAVVAENGDLQSTSPFWLPTMAYLAAVMDADLERQLPVHRRQLLSPIAFSPCSILGLQNRSQRALPEPGHSGFWLNWRNAEALGDANIKDAGRTVRDRLRDFAEAFPHLVGYHDHAPMLVQFIGVTPTKDIAAGIQEFLEWHVAQTDANPDATGNLRLRVEFFVEDPKMSTEFDERMANDNVVHGPYGFDPLHEFVIYAKRSVQSLVSKGPQWGHVTFIGRGFRQMPEIVASSELLPKARAGGIVVAPTMDLPSLANHNPDRVGFGTKGLANMMGPQSLAMKMAEVQACIVHSKPYAYRVPGQVPATTATAQVFASLRQLYDKSIWVVHLEPGVSLIPLKSDKHHESVLIHFTDQDNPTSPGFDQVTLTKQKKAFDNCLDGICRDLKIVKPDGLLPLLNSINSRWALQLFSNNRKRRMEKIACAIASQATLQRARESGPGTLWLVSGWEQFNRLTGGTGLPTAQGAFGGGSRSGTDDVILVGLNPDRPDQVRVLLVEVKYGHAGEDKGAKQIEQTYFDLNSHMAAEGLSGRIFRMEFGAFVARIAERLYVHGAIRRDDLRVVERAQDYLYEGTFSLDWGDHDGLPKKGLVIRVDPTASERSKREGAHGIEIQRIPWAEAAYLDATMSREDQGPGSKIELKEYTESKAAKRDQTDAPRPIQHMSITPPTPRHPTPKPPAEANWPRDVLAAGPVRMYETPAVDVGRFFGIDEMLRQLGADVDPPLAADIVVGPQATAVHLKLRGGTRVSKIEQALTNLKLSLGVTKDLSLSTYERAGHVTLFVPHELKRPVPISGSLDSAPLSELTLPFPAGITAENKPLWLDLVTSNHLLVAGSTGSGKTVYLQGLVLTLAVARPPRQLRINLVDPKQLDFAILERLPHCDGPVVADTDGTMSLLDRLILEVKARQSTLKNDEARNIGDYHRKHGPDSLPYVVTIIDEYNQLLMACPDKAARNALEDKICQLAQIGRALGIYLVVATQRPSTDVVSGRIKANFPTRMSFRLPSNTDSRVILDDGGAELLQPGGDGLVAGLGGLRRFQAFYLEQHEMRGLVDAMNSINPRFEAP